MEEVLTGAEVAPEASNVVEEAVPVKKQRKPINQQKLQDNLWGWIFCLPLIVGTVWFVYIALVIAVLLSFTNYRIGMDGEMMEYIANLAAHTDFTVPITTATGEPSAVTGAFANYAAIFSNYIKINLATGGTTYYLESMIYLLNTVFYMIGIPIGMVLSVFFAVCMSRDIKGGNFFRILYYLPCVASTISVVFTFQNLFNTNGVINQILGTTQESGQALKWLAGGGLQDMTWNSMSNGGVASSAVEGDFMNNPYWCQGMFSKLTIVIMSVWKGLGGTIILYVAGLSGVNASTKEAAEIDGANGWQIFWKITMPDLYPTIFYNMVTAVIGGLQIYAEPELFASGSAPYQVKGYVSLIYNYGLAANGGTNMYAGRGGAYGIFLGLIILVLTLFQFWLDGKNKD